MIISDSYNYYDVYIIIYVAVYSVNNIEIYFIIKLISISYNYYSDILLYSFSNSTIAFILNNLYH